MRAFLGVAATLAGCYVEGRPYKSMTLLVENKLAKQIQTDDIILAMFTPQ